MMPINVGVFTTDFDSLNYGHASVFILIFCIDMIYLNILRYHNIMGIETIGVLELLTTSITDVITHATMADRNVIDVKNSQS